MVEGFQVWIWRRNPEGVVEYLLFSIPKKVRPLKPREQAHFWSCLCSSVADSNDVLEGARQLINTSVSFGTAGPLKLLDGTKLVIQEAGGQKTDCFLVLLEVDYDSTVEFHSPYHGALWRVFEWACAHVVGLVIQENGLRLVHKHLEPVPINWRGRMVKWFIGS